MKREQHVRHLLVRYVTGQLNPRQASRVRAHLSVCPSCRAEMSEREAVASQLRRTASRVEEPSTDLVKDWWRVIQLQGQTRRSRQQYSTIVSLLAPLAMSLLLLTGILGTEASSTQAAVSTTYGSPAIDTTVEPTSRAYLDGLVASVQPKATATPDPAVADITIPTAPRSVTN